MAMKGVTKEQINKSSQGIISGVASHVSGIGSLLSNIPLIGGVASTVSGIAGTVSGVAKALGFDKPSTIAATQPVRVRYVETNTGVGVDDAPVLSVNPDAKLLPLGSEVGASVIDTDLKSIAQKPMLFLNLDLQNLGPQQLVTYWPVHPAYAPGESLDENIQTRFSMIHHTYNSFVANLYRSWRGSMVYRLKFLASPYHSARYRIMWIPRDPTPTAVLTAENEHLFPSIVVDVRGDTEVAFSVPYLSSRYTMRSSLMELSALWAKAYSSYGSEGNITLNNIGKTPFGTDISNGCIAIFQETELTYPTSPVPQIYLLGYSATGSDIQFFEPNTESFSNSVDRFDGAIPLIRPYDSVTMGDVAPVRKPLPTVMSADLEEDSNASLQEMLTNFEDSPVIEEPAMTIGSTPGLHAPADPTIANFLARPRMIFNGPWAHSDSRDVAYFVDPLLAFLSEPIVWHKLEGYRYLKCDVVVEIRINGSPFHYGALGYSALPFGANVQDGLSQVRLTGFPGGVITPNQTSSVRLRLPFLYNKQAFDLEYLGSPESPTFSLDPTFWNTASCGKVAWYVLNELRGGTVTGAEIETPDVHVAFYAYLENVHLAGPTSQTFRIPSKNVESYPSPNIPTKQGIMPSSVVNVSSFDAACVPFAFAKPPALPQVMGWTNDESCDIAPICPQGASSTLPVGTSYGEEVTNVKVLARRVGDGGNIPLPTDSETTTYSSGFVSHFMSRVERCPSGKVTHFGSSPVVNVTVSGATDVAFLDVFREIFLAERGSVTYKVVTNDGATPVSAPNLMRFAKDTRQVGMFTTNANKFNCETSNNLFGAIASYAGTVWSEGSSFTRNDLIEAPMCNVPYTAWQPFSYVPTRSLTSSTPAYTYLVPTIQDCPGAAYSIGTNNGTFLRRLALLKAAGDDFQFIHLVPPRRVAWMPTAFNR